MHSDIEKYNLLDLTDFYSPPDPSDKFRLATRSLKKFLKIFTRGPLRSVHPLNYFEYGSYVKTLEALYLFDHIQERSYDFDVLHCHFGWNGILGAMLKNAGLLNCTLAVGFYGSDLNVFPNRWGKQGYRKLFEVADLLLPVSNFFRHKLINMGCPDEKISVHHFGVDCEGYTITEPQTSDNETIQVLSIARLIKMKGIQHGLRAIARLRTDHLISYRIVGDGPYRDQLEEETRNLNLTDCVEFVGRKPRGEVKELLEQSDVLLAPSVEASTGSKEGMPMVIIEAMASGIPVISSQLSGIPEMLDHGTSGFLTEPGDNKAIADRLRDLISNPSLVQEMGKQARKRVEEQFNIEKQTDKLLDKFRRVGAD